MLREALIADFAQLRFGLDVYKRQVYEGEDIPADFICPLCKHGVADFEKIK